MNRLCTHAGIEVPVICGAMYPCSNPELVAAVSEAGGLGIIQPISLTYVHGHEFREGLRFIRSLTAKPIGMNALIEQSSKRYRERMEEWVDIALEEGVRFFVTSLGKPGWVVKRVHAAGGVVYHDVTERKWAQKGLDDGVDGLICVNNHAGGHAGEQEALALYESLSDFNVPLVSAGGVASPESFKQILEMGYEGVQMGTAFIATHECRANDEYKQAIVSARAQDIVLTKCMTGVPVSVIHTPYIDRLGLKAGWFARWMLKGRRRKHWMRTFYAIKSLVQLRKALLDDKGRRDYWQAGKSVASVDAVRPAAEIVNALGAVYRCGQS